MVYLLNSFQESQSSPVLTLNRTAQYQKILSGESHSSGASSRNGKYWFVVLLHLHCRYTEMSLQDECGCLLQFLLAAVEFHV